MIKLIDILNEIGEGTAQKYPWTFKIERENDGITYFEYEFKTATTPYSVILTEEELNIGNGVYEMMIAFGVGRSIGKQIIQKATTSVGGKPSPSGVNFNQVVNKGEIFRVMATVIDIVEDAIVRSEKKGKPVAVLSFRPTKEKETSSGYKLTDQRAQLYKAYIDKHLDRVQQTRVRNGEVEVILK